MPPTLSISEIGPESQPILGDLFQHYLHDMAEWFGPCSYDVSSIWEKGYQAYLAKVGDTIAGFALIGSADEWLGPTGAHDVDEFFVLPGFRRTGVGRQMATLLWNQHPGPWLVRVLEANTPAALFWRDAISTYSHGSYKEEQRITNGRPWRFFRFESRASHDLYFPPSP